MDYYKSLDHKTVAGHEMDLVTIPLKFTGSEVPWLLPTDIADKCFEYVYDCSVVGENAPVQWGCDSPIRRDRAPTVDPAQRCGYVKDIVHDQAHGWYMAVWMGSGYTEKLEHPMCVVPVYSGITDANLKSIHVIRVLKFCIDVDRLSTF